MANEVIKDVLLTAGTRTKFTESLGGENLERELDEAINSGVPAYLVGSLLEVVRSQVVNYGDRFRIGREIRRLTTEGGLLSDKVLIFVDNLLLDVNPDRVILTNAFYSMEVDDVKAIVAGIGGGLQDQGAREGVVNVFMGREEVIKSSVGPGRKEMLERVPKQVEAIAACIREGKSH